MKKVIVALLMGMGIVCTVQEAHCREFREHLSKEFVLTGNGSVSTLFIYNISGFIRVEGYSGNKVLLEMEKTISADDDKNLETGKKEFRLAFDQRSDTVMAYIAEPYDSRPRRQWYHNDDRREIEYNYKV